MNHTRPSQDPLESRIYKVKNPHTRFFCPLCRTERAFKYHYRLRPKHYLQIFLSASFLGLLFFSLMGVRVFFFYFVVWAGFELTNRMLYRKEIPCPHCGFDASWYKKDIKVTRKLIDEFWRNEQVPASPDEDIDDTGLPPHAEGPGQLELQ